MFISKLCSSKRSPGAPFAAVLLASLPCGFRLVLFKLFITDESTEFVEMSSFSFLIGARRSSYCGFLSFSSAFGAGADGFLPSSPSSFFSTSAPPLAAGCFFMVCNC